MQPYLRSCDTRESYEKLAALASAAWNISNLPDNERIMMHARIHEIFPPADREYAERLISDLQKRKEELFPDDERHVTETRVIDEGSNFRIVAVAVSASS